MSLIDQVASLKRAKALSETVEKNIKRAFRGSMEVLLDIDDTKGVVTIRLGKDEITMPAIVEACRVLECPLENVVLAKVRDDNGLDWLALEVTLVADPSVPSEK
jgi:hypothetical protein